MHRMKKPKGRRARPIDSTARPLSVEYLQGLRDMSTLETVEDVVQDALHGGVAMQFVQWFLNLRKANSTSTKRMQVLQSNWSRRGTRNGPHWTTLFSQSTWTCFMSLTKPCIVSQSQHVDARLENLSREQAPLLAGTRVVNSRKPKIAEQSLRYA